MNNIKVSIIIPVYNSEQFLNKCLHSVVSQTAENFEIIIVNDGSTDGSQKIIEDYAKKFLYITVINQENSGQAIARNRALQIAKGEYCAFVDSDDYIETKMVETLYNEAVSRKADIVICNWNEVDVNGRCLKHKEYEEYHKKMLTKEEVVEEFLMNKRQLIEGFSWNKLIKRSLFDEYKILYPNMKYEDIPTIFKVLMKANTFVYVNDHLYNYVQHDKSTVHIRNEETAKGYLTAIQMVKQILKDENLLSKYNDQYLNYSMNCILREYGLSYDTIKNHTELKKSYREFLKLNFPLLKNGRKEYKLRIKMGLYKLGLLPYILKLYSKYT
jgi:glycosyltransferase involved in cell wall biosynthesis